MPTIYVVFKKAVETHVESVVQWFSGPMIHVDIVPGNLPLSFTSYMFETFSVNPMTGYHPDKHTCLGIEVTQAEHDEAHNMLTRFVQKGFQYNYNDVIRSILPGPVLASDVKSEDEISTLYCSQAVTLVLRMCLIENKELIAALGGLNSRFTTPNMLKFSEPGMAIFRDVSVNTGDSRQAFADDVPREIRRFIWCTSPHKCWAEYLADNWYSTVHVMRKYDGWFLVVYVDYGGNVRWQTTSGFVHSALALEVEPLKLRMESLVALGTLRPTHAFKIEIVVTNDAGGDFLHMIGRKLDGQYYRLIVTDFFQPYSLRMVQDLNARLDAQRASAAKFKAAPLSAERWLDSFRANQGAVPQRLANAQVLLAGLFNVRIGDCASMHKGVANISGKRIVVRVSKLLTEQPVEGFVLHCTERSGKHVVYKAKLEYMGGLGSFYSPALDYEIGRWNATLAHPCDFRAGRQFVVRCLTVECYHDTHIPMRIGLGYYDDDLCTWVVSDCIKVKYSGGPRAGRYIDVQEVGGKHAGITRQTQHIANMIARVLDAANPAMDASNLHLTSHFKKESSGNFLNVAELGIIVGGNANHVYRSESGNFHLQASVLKCMGMATTSSHAFTDAEIQDARESTTPVIHGIPEWTKADWARMVDLKNSFNASNVLSVCSADCMLWQSIDATRACPHVPRLIFSKLQNLHGVRCCCFRVAEKNRIALIVRRIQGQCVEFPREGVEKIDIVFVPVKNFTEQQFDIVRAQIQEPFLTVRCSWALKCEKRKFEMPDIGQYTVQFTAETQDEQRFLWNRSRMRLMLPVPDVVPAAEELPDVVPHAEELPDVLPVAEELPIPDVVPAAEELPIPDVLPVAEELPVPEVMPVFDVLPAPEARPAPAPHLPLRARLPLARKNFRIHSEGPSVSREVKFVETQIEALGGSCMDYGSSYVITRFPRFKYGARYFSHCTHAMYFVVMHHIRDKFNEDGTPLDYREDEWANHFKFRVAEDYIVCVQSPFRRYDEASSLRLDMSLTARFVLRALFQVRDIDLNDLLWVTSDA